LVTFTDEEYEQMAIQAIIEYKNKNFTDEEIRKKYSLPIKMIIENIKQSSTIDKNIKSETQGPRSTTYKDGGIVIIDSLIEKLLGSSYVRMC